MIAPQVVLSQLSTLIVRAADQAPKPEDVKAGWMAFVVFIALIVAVGLLGWSLSRHLRRAQDNRDVGLFGDEPAEKEQSPSSAA